MLILTATPVVILAQSPPTTAASGTPHDIQQRLSKPYNFKSSPPVVNDRVYLATEDDVVVVKAGDQFEVLATNTLTDQAFIASQAAVGNDLYLRSRTRFLPSASIEA